MRRKEDRPLQKVTLNLFDGDFDRLRDAHGRLGAGKVIRELVRAHLAKINARVEQKTGTLALPEIE